MKYALSPLMRGVTVLLVLIIAGCSTIPTGRYEALHGASAEILSKSSQTYHRIELLQRDFAVLTAPNQPLTAESFLPTAQGMSYDIGPELHVRENALRVLVDYTALLYTLASRNNGADVDRAAQELGASLSGITGAAEGPPIGNLMATVADGVARGVTEQIRSEALATAMDQAQPAVTALCSLVRGSNEKIVVFVTIMESRYIAHANDNRPPYGSWARYTFDQEVAGRLEKISQIRQVLSIQAAALEKFPEAHREIRASLEQRESTPVALRAMLGEAHRLQEFYENLPP